MDRALDGAVHRLVDSAGFQTFASISSWRTFAASVEFVFGEATFGGCAGASFIRGDRSTFGTTGDTRCVLSRTAVWSPLMVWLITFPMNKMTFCLAGSLCEPPDKLTSRHDKMSIAGVRESNTGDSSGLVRSVAMGAATRDHRASSEPHQPPVSSSKKSQSDPKKRTPKKPAHRPALTLFQSESLNPKPGQIRGNIGNAKTT